MYPFLRALLFKLEPEQAHSIALTALRYTPQWCFETPRASSNQVVHALGMTFLHPIGLAAGLDKNGDHLEALNKLGFSFIEVGTVTPKPQAGNPKPRLFRLPKAQAIINRMGFNNKGVDALVEKLSSTPYKGILGVNIGKNKDTSLENAAQDYLTCLRKVYPFSSYVAVNISSPNTPNLRALQSSEYFQSLMTQLKAEQRILADTHQRHVPLVIKISPDETEDALQRLANTIAELKIEGIIATNTTSFRDAVSELPFGDETGGLSGEPLLNRSTECIRLLKKTVGDDVTLIGVGGIMHAQAAKEKLIAGADLIQIYTGLIYQGPAFIKNLVEGMNDNDV